MFHRRVLTVALAVAAALLPVLATSAFVAPGASGASTQDELDAARQQLTAARAEATEASAAFNAADGKVTETESRVAELEASIAEKKTEAAGLHQVVRERAIYAYVHQHENLDLVVDAAGTVQAARKRQLLDLANQRDSLATRKLAAINEDLHDQQRTLEAQQAQQTEVKNQLGARNADLQSKLAAAQTAANELQSKLDSEIAAAKAAADAERERQLQAEQANLAAAKPVSASAQASTGAGTVIGSPVGGFQCPVAGSAYTDAYHGGLDLMVPQGTPLVAVKQGFVQFNPYPDPAGGNTAYLSADDGNVYYYAHLSSFVGSDRNVSQGEIIGYSGMTGNASAPHLHFEIRLGGVNGGKIDPYSTLRASGC
jgi:murein DD-endopeptidase MepM/ murein hydrolase activator NlpD